MEKERSLIGGNVRGRELVGDEAEAVRSRVRSGRQEKRVPKRVELMSR